MGRIFFVRVFIPATVCLLAAWFGFINQTDNARQNGQVTMLLLVAWALCLAIGFGLVIINHFLKKLITQAGWPIYSNDIISAAGVLYGLFTFISFINDDDLLFKSIAGLFIAMNIAVIVFCRVRKTDVPASKTDAEKPR